MKKLFLTIISGLFFMPQLFAAGTDANVNNNAVYQASGNIGAAQSVAVPVISSATEETQVAGMKLPLAKKKWTIMVYIVGKNNLSGDGLDDVAEMQKVGSDANLNVIVERGTMEKGGTFGPVERIYAKKTGWVSGPQSLVLQSWPQADMGDWKRAAAFAKYAKTNFPADKYMLVLWNHGSGWISFEKPMQGTAPKDNETLEPAGRGIGYDDETNNHITTIEMRALLKEIGGVDVYASDACLMADIAVDAEISKYTKFIVGSEETEPASGYEYTGMLKRFAKKPDMSAEQAAIAVAEAYYDSHMFSLINNHLGAGMTVSVLNTERIFPLSRAIKDFVDLAVASPDTKALKKGYSEAHRFAYDHAADLYDFMRIVRDNTTDNRLKGKANQIMIYIEHRAIIKNLVRGKSKGFAYGIACYLPPQMYFPEYDELMFAKYTGWGKLVKHIKGAL